MPLTKEVRSILEKASSHYQDNIARAKTEGRDKHAGYIAHQQHGYDSLQKAIKTGILNPEAKQAIKSEIVNINDDVYRSKMQLKGIDGYKPHRSDMVSREEYEQRLKDAVKSGEETLKVLKKNLEK